MEIEIMDDFTINESFPTIITPKNINISFQYFLQALSTYKSEIEKILLKKGALLFRGFPINSADHFEKVVEVVNLGDFVNYIGGDSPRKKVKNKVYTSTETPPSFHLPLHQELSYVKHFPKHIYFFCEIEPSFRGETIIADARNVYASLAPDIINKFAEKGLMYISHYYYKSKMMELLNHSHKSWVDVFETNNKKEVEAICKANEIDWRWLANDWIEIKETRPALLEHPLTKEKVWFNQAHLFDFNPKLLGLMRYLGVKLFYFRPSTCLHEMTFADGSRIPRKALYHILDTLDKNTVAYPWRKSDVMILDNILAMHGRAPFKGPRRILTALTK